MATKEIELTRANAGQGCLGKAEPEEPVFVLRGQDMLAPGAIRHWATQAMQAGVSWAKIQEALDCAMAMDAYQIEHKHKFPD